MDIEELNLIATGEPILTESLSSLAGEPYDQMIAISDLNPAHGTVVLCHVVLILAQFGLDSPWSGVCRQQSRRLFPLLSLFA